MVGLGRRGSHCADDVVVTRIGSALANRKPSARPLAAYGTHRFVADADIRG